ncbi:hypothetical protein SeMB42_g05773 [Synchytrium endobioticum]|uniref:Uncharacterized protein n=1 Tax=Synchytrium endobioticum TaxID=286115 RepID=A0A507CPK8_9FUNG|nr:hypothetical protein SeMB42_g05773 [Synchytrium endobioticum]TPX41155.1 hypothetical protein SeLEV6574_g06231 [Synchytrium endobioticum]
MLKKIYTTGQRQHGNGLVTCRWQSRSSLFLAVVGPNRIVQLIDRQGSILDSFLLQSECSALEWAPDGSCLAASSHRSGSICIWDATEGRQASTLETGYRGIAFLSWSPDSERLVVADKKGNILLHERKTARNLPIQTKHSKEITCACWNESLILTLGSDDQTFSMWTTKGEDILHMALKGKPRTPLWSTARINSALPEPVLSIIVGTKTLCLFPERNLNTPIELAFQPRYGDIVSYDWYGDGNLLVAFSSGNLVAVSTNKADLGQEIGATRDHKDGIVDLALSLALNKAVTCGDDCLKLHDLADVMVTDAIVNLEEERGQLSSLNFSDDGQFLTVGTKTGSTYSYLARLPLLASVNGSIVAFMSSLQELTVADQCKLRLGVAGICTSTVCGSQEMEIEPTLIALGPGHTAVAHGNKTRFYILGSSAKIDMQNKIGKAFSFGTSTLNTALIAHRDYSALVVGLWLNTRYAGCLLSTGQLIIHSIEVELPDDPPPTALEHVYPDSCQLKSTKITCATMTNDFIAYGDALGVIRLAGFDEWKTLHEIHASSPIAGVYSQIKGGAKVIYLTDDGNAGIVNPVSGLTVDIPNPSPNRLLGFLWDSQPAPPANIFCAWDDQNLYTYTFHPTTLRGPTCLMVGNTRLPYGLKPLLVLDGVVTCLTPSGRLFIIPLSSHQAPLPADFPVLQSEEAGCALQMLYNVGKLAEVWCLIGKLTHPKPWEMLADAALTALDLSTALRVYRDALNDLDSLAKIEAFAFVENIKTLCGHVASFFGEYDLAQEYFLDSPEPMAALELRRNLKQWDRALKIASKLAPVEVTTLSKFYAQQLEAEGKHSEALTYYHQALSTSSSFVGTAVELELHQVSCSAGLLRETLRSSDIAKGLSMLSETNDPSLLAECAMILRERQDHGGVGLARQEGELWERAERWQEAADAYTRAKAWNHVARVLPKLGSDQTTIYGTFAKAKEAEGKYADAADAYEKSMDYGSVVRLCIEKLRDVPRATDLVRKTKSKDAAHILSNHYRAIGDYRSVIDFCLLADMKNEAFEIAQQNDVMDHYAELVQNQATPELLSTIAAFFESKRSYYSAGRYLMRAGQYARALHCFLQAPPTPAYEAVDAAIECVGLAKNDALTHQLVDYLMGERDGIPKDSKYVFQLYTSLGQYREAGRSAVIIAKREQERGNYRAAHNMLLDYHRTLRSKSVKVPAELDKMLMLLHSYLLVKVLVKCDDHTASARLLVRVAGHISLFPEHAIPILVSTVIECYRSNMKKSAFNHAALLMRPENRDKIEEKHRKKIEGIVRRPEYEETEEPCTPCPFCSTSLPETSLDCHECKNTLPYCIATGRHMLVNEWSLCPKCRFPGLYSRLSTVVSQTGSCPMCAAPLRPDEVKKMRDGQKELSIWQGKLPQPAALDDGEVRVTSLPRPPATAKAEQQPTPDRRLSIEGTSGAGSPDGMQEVVVKPWQVSRIKRSFGGQGGTAA